jgi:hypothetical protein
MIVNQAPPEMRRQPGPKAVSRVTISRLSWPPPRRQAPYPSHFHVTCPVSTDCY